MKCSFYLRLVGGLLLSVALVTTAVFAGYMTQPVWNWIFFGIGSVAFLIPVVGAVTGFLCRGVSACDPCHIFVPIFLLAYILFVTLMVGGCGAEGGKGVYYDLNNWMIRIFLGEVFITTTLTFFLWIVPYCLKINNRIIVV